MNDDEKLEIKIKILFLLNIIMFLVLMVMLFKIVETNNEMTVWLLEHGRLK